MRRCSHALASWAGRVVCQASFAVQYRSMVAVAKVPRIVRGLVFDMDGTLTVPSIDFALMRSRCGVGTTGDILDVINARPEPERAAAHAIIAEFEQEVPMAVSWPLHAKELMTSSKFSTSNSCPRKGCRQCA